MPYTINARLDQGIPSLTLVDSLTGEERLYWRNENNGQQDWQRLFKQLVLLSCVDRLSMPARAKSAQFGDECVRCTECTDTSTADSNIIPFRFSRKSMT